MKTWRARYLPEIMAALVASGSLFGAWSLGLRAPPAAAPAKTASAERGRHLFIQSCAHCHGDGPDLYRLAIGNARIATVIRSGIPDEMPSFAKKHGSADRADLTAYLRTLH